MLREDIRDNVADEVSTVASRSLGAENVQQKAQELAKALLQQLLNDPTVRTHTGVRGQVDGVLQHSLLLCSWSVPHVERYRVHPMQDACFCAQNSPPKFVVRLAHECEFSVVSRAYTRKRRQKLGCVFCSGATFTLVNAVACEGARLREMAECAEYADTVLCLVLQCNS